MNGKIAKNFNPVSLAAVFVLALSPDVYAEKDALISVWQAQIVMLQARHF